MDIQRASSLIKEEACRLGFDACGIAQAAPAGTEALFFDRWLASGGHAGMKYMENHRALRLDPAGLVEGAQSVISVALNYYPGVKQAPGAPRIAYYAYGRDYHDILKEKLRRLLAYIRDILASLPDTPPFEARVFTDSAPLLERYWAWKAGLGWIGKNTCLIIPGRGSFFFLGEIVLNRPLAYDSPVKSRCGACTRCLEACPTGALERARFLNAARCLSYLTIEHRGEIPEAQAARMGERLYGCDTCQTACPWNRFASPTPEEAFRPKPELLVLDKAQLSALSPEEYDRLFRGSAVKRAKYEGLMRNIRCLMRNEKPVTEGGKEKADQD